MDPKARSMAWPANAPVRLNRCASRQPAIRHVPAHQTVQLARRAHPFQARVEPQRQQHLRIRGRTPRLAIARPNRLVKSRQFQRLDKPPYQPGTMVRRQQSSRSTKSHDSCDRFASSTRTPSNITTPPALTTSITQPPTHGNLSHARRPGRRGMDRDQHAVFPSGLCVARDRSLSFGLALGDRLFEIFHEGVRYFV